MALVGIKLALGGRGTTPLLLITSLAHSGRAAMLRVIGRIIDKSSAGPALGV
jgi:hypothetical protein